MAYALVASTINSSADGLSVTSSSFNSTGADKIILCFVLYPGAAIVITCSKGNSFTQRKVADLGAAGSVYIYESPDSPVVGSSHTIKVEISGGGSCYPALAVYAFSGAATTPFDQSSSATGSGTSLASGSVTPSEDNEVIVGAFHGYASGSGITCDVGTYQAVGFVGGTAYALGTSYEIQTAQTARNLTWTPSASQTYLAACVATFKAASGGGPTARVRGLVNRSLVIGLTGGLAR